MAVHGSLACMHAPNMEAVSTTSQQRCCRLREAPYRRPPEGLQASAVMDSVSSVSVAATAPVSTSTICRPSPPGAGPQDTARADRQAAPPV